MKVSSSKALGEMSFATAELKKKNLFFNQYLGKSDLRKKNAAEYGSCILLVQDYR